MNIITLIGLSAGMMTTIAFVPQIVKVYRTRQTKDLALYTYVILSCGVALWIIYGILLKELPIIITNIAVFIMSNYLIFMKIKHG